MLAHSASNNSPEANTRELTTASETLYNLLVADIALHRNDPKEAYERLEIEAQKHPSAPLAKELWSIASVTNNPEWLQTSSQLWLKSDPKDIDAHRAILAQAITAQKTDVIQKEIPYIIEHSKDKKAWIESLISVLGNQPKVIPVAKPAIEKALSDIHDKPWVLSMKASLLKGENQFAQACKLGQTAVKLAPNDSNVLKTVADICWREDKPATIALLEAYMQKHPKDSDIDLILGRALMREQHIPEATARLENLVKKHPKNLTVLFNSALIADQAHQVALAEKWYNAYIEASKRSHANKRLKSDRVFINLGNLYMAQNRFSEAAKTFSQIKGGEDLILSRILEALAYVNLKEYKKAENLLAALEKYNLSDSDNEKIARLKTEMYAAQYDNAKAFKTIEALALKSDDVQLKVTTAALALHSDEPEKAKVLLEQALEKAPNNPLVGALYASYEARAKHDLTSARRHMEKAFSQAPLNVEILGEMARLCYEEGRYDQAIEFSMVSLKRRFQLDTAQTLIMTLLKLKRLDEAQTVFNQALERSANAPTLQQWGTHLGLKLP